MRFARSAALVLLGSSLLSSSTRADAWSTRFAGSIPTPAVRPASDDGGRPVPVGLIDFRVRWDREAARITWKVVGVTEDVAGFNVHREISAEERVRINDRLLGNASEFSILDPGAPMEGARYWLEEVARSGDPYWHGPAVLGASPSFWRIAVEPGVPNPFAASTTVRFRLPSPGFVSIRVIDLRGRRVADLWDGIRSAGEGEARWDGRSTDGRAVSDGIYFLVIRNGIETAATKLLLRR